MFEWVCCIFLIYTWQAKRQNLPFIVLGTGKAFRQFLFAKDMAHLTLWVLDNYDNLEPIILAPDEEDEVR
jgi:GDP-L-fucose synthase